MLPSQVTRRRSPSAETPKVQFLFPATRSQRPKAGGPRPTLTGSPRAGTVAGPGPLPRGPRWTPSHGPHSSISPSVADPPRPSTPRPLPKAPALWGTPRGAAVAPHRRGLQAQMSAPVRQEATFEGQSAYSTGPPKQLALAPALERAPSPRPACLSQGKGPLGSPDLARLTPMRGGRSSALLAPPSRSAYLCQGHCSCDITASTWAAPRP